MGFEVTVTGGADLRRVQDRLRAVGDQGLGKQMAAGFRRATAPLKPAVRAEALTAMPSGYGPTLSRSMQFRQTGRGGGTSAEVVVRVYGKGRKNRRMVPALNRGQLRHPLYGRRGHWFDQRVRAGFVDRPADRLLPDAVRQMDAVVSYVAEQIGA